MPNAYNNRVFLRRRYVIERKSMAEIASEAGVSEMTVSRWLRFHGLT
jgi:DNA-binding MurR/RpiR family transcriptional regulator